MSEAVPMRVWVDADACPRAAKDQVIKFALKRKFEVLLSAGRAKANPPFPSVLLMAVRTGPVAPDAILAGNPDPVAW